MLEGNTYSNAGKQGHNFDRNKKERKLLSSSAINRE